MNTFIEGNIARTRLLLGYAKSARSIPGVVVAGQPHMNASIIVLITCLAFFLDPHTTLPDSTHAPIQGSCCSSSSSSRRGITSNMADEIDAARARMIAKRFGGAENVRTGGKGTVRRKRKAQHKNSSTADDKKLGATLKKLGVTNIPGIEEANMFKNNGEVIHFRNPKGELVEAQK